VSDKCRAYVWERSPYKDKAFTVHLALGDTANDLYGYRIFYTQGKLAAKTRTTPKTLRTIFDQMIADGFLEELDGLPPQGGGRAIRQFRFLMPDVPVVWTEDASDNGKSRPIGNGKPRPIDDGSQLPIAMGSGVPHDGSPLPIEPKRTKLEPKKPSTPNPAWDAIVAVVGWEPTSQQEKKRVGQAVREITKAILDHRPDTSPEDIAKHITARGARYRQAWPQAELTPEALAKHWSRFGPNGNGGRPPGPAPVASEAELLAQRNMKAARAARQQSEGESNGID
jgi:hypothetical protein